MLSSHPWHIPEDTLALNLMYTLEKLSPCLDLQLLQFLLDEEQTGNNNYFEMKWRLNEMCARGLCTCQPKGLSMMYTLTDAGHETVAMFENRVLKSVRDRVQAQAATWKARFEQENHATAIIRQKESGEFETRMTLADLKMELMTISLAVSSNEMANEVSKRWKKKADMIYAYITKVLGEDEPENPEEKPEYNP